MFLARALLVLTGVAGIRADPPASQDGAVPGHAPARSHEKLREHLQELPPEERALLERHLDEFEGLSPQSRARLLERARALRERERSEAGAREARPRTDGRMEGFDGERSREAWVAHLRERFREHGRELRARLPEKLRQKLEHAPAETRRRFLEKLFQERERVSRGALEHMRVHYGLSKRDIERLERMPLPERLSAMVELGDPSKGSPR